VQRQLTSVLQLSERYRSKITTELQRNSFFDLEQGVYDLAISYESGIEGNYERAFEYSEKSRARSLLDEVQSGAKLRKKQGEIYVSLPVVTPSLSLGEIQSRMPAQAQILEYAVLDDRVVAWIVTGAKVEHQAVPVRAEVLTEKVGAFLDRVNRPPAPSDNSYRERASELYSLLIEPIADRLDKSRTLCIVPDKILNYLPYAALISPKTGGYLIDEYDLDFAASAALFVSQSAAAERKARKSEERLLVVGNPKFSRRRFPLLRDLPSSELECNSVAQIYRQSDREPKVLLRDEATETAVEREMKEADVAHFAMHFVLNERSEMFSGFPLTPEVADAAGSEGSAKSDPVSKSEQSSDGVLQSYEIYGMNLRRTRLVVLSACQTGIERQYRGEGAVGAARPFFVAGVPTVVASLWPVDSDASADLMVSFHKHLHERLSAPQALRSAQREMLAGGNATYHHPYYWAPFLAIGGLSQN
jgi:CHAT domain-containing protein